MLLWLGFIGVGVALTLPSLVALVIITEMVNFNLCRL